MTGNKIKALRKLMQEHKIQAYLIPSTDPIRMNICLHYGKTQMDQRFHWFSR